MNKVNTALNFITQHCPQEDHHKQWLIDQVVRILTGSEKGYLDWVNNFCDGEDGPNTYNWDTGIIP